METNLIWYSYKSSTNNSNLSGKAYDKLTQEPLVGASITLLPCNKETAANIDGNYSFDFLFTDCDSIKISYIGYLTKVISIRELIEKFSENNGH